MRLTECEVSWLEDAGISKTTPQDQDTSMSDTPIISLRALRKCAETQNHYIPRVNTFSTLLGGFNQRPPELLSPNTPK